MRTFRTHRTARSRSALFAATGVALAALALTACEDGTGMQDEGASQPAATATTSRPAALASPSAPASGPAAKPTAGSGTAQDGATGTTPGNGKTAVSSKNTGKGTGRTTGGTSDPDATENRVSCNGSNTTVTARPVPRPLNHLLITVTNTGSKNCDLTYYPVLRFDEMQWVPQAVAASRPQAVTTLAPGESGYAGVLLSAADGSGEHGTTARKLTVGFQGRTPNSDGGPAAVPSLPAGGVYYDSSLAVTYWQADMADALAY
ncbi:DUF4232 domain-containing protein [Streptomyces sp. NPDC085946]|uniref:DUF4232 domain-containing protein n=1 Tax=Streptomyces sp. NPDC085946 TaxID=3365744 RepID=UPI0037D11FFA